MNLRYRTISPSNVLPCFRWEALDSQQMDFPLVRDRDISSNICSNLLSREETYYTTKTRIIMTRVVPRWEAVPKGIFQLVGLKPVWTFKSVENRIGSMNFAVASNKDPAPKIWCLWQELHQINKGSCPLFKGQLHCIILRWDHQVIIHEHHSIRRLIQ